MKNQLLLITAIALGSLSAQPVAKDPFVKGTPAEAPESRGPAAISICYETFSLPLAMAAKIQRGNPTDAEMYALFIASLDKDNVRQENFAVLRAKSGQKATTESISEQIYGTEYEPPELPGSLGVAISPPKKKEAPEPVKDPAKPETTPEKVVQQPKEIPNVDASRLEDAPEFPDLNNIATPATPTAFEVRNTGFTFEIEPTLGENDELVDLRLVPEHVALVGHSTQGQGRSTVEMPIFESQRVNTSLILRVNQPALLGTLSRPPVSKQDPDSANRVWFAFVTATLARP